MTVFVAMLATDGRESIFRRPEEAIEAEISAVHQERNLVPAFPVAEKPFLSRIAASSRSK